MSNNLPNTATYPYVVAFRRSDGSLTRIPVDAFDGTHAVEVALRTTKARLLGLTRAQVAHTEIK